MVLGGVGLVLDSATIILIILGSIIMLSSIVSFHKLIRKSRENAYKTETKKKHWVFFTCLSMMYSFLAGYGAVLFFVFRSEFQLVYFIVALIFFFGAVFVGTMVHALWFMNLSLSKKNSELMDLLVTSIEMKDLYTKGHSRHVCDIVELFFDFLPQEYKACLSKAKMRDAALLHDIGKIGIPDAILNKPGKLDEEEWRYMRLHPENGKLLLDKTSFEEISNWVYYHHERIDGQGYYGLSGDQIPIEARIITIADAFSALNTDRVYRKRFSYERCLEILDKDAGTHLDTNLLSCFKRIPKEALEKAYDKHRKDCADIFCLNRLLKSEKGEQF